MPFKINVADKTGKTFKLEAEAEELVGKELHEKIKGEDISQELKGYEFEITGASDKAGFASKKDVSGAGLSKVLLTFGKYMNKKPKREGKKQIGKNRPKGLRLRKTVRGKVISPAISQINLKIIKEGSKKLQEIFPEQNQPKPKKEEGTSPAE
jgi:small subunit ribosomal protein S6e